MVKLLSFMKQNKGVGGGWWVAVKTIDQVGLHWVSRSNKHPAFLFSGGCTGSG